MVLGQGDVDVAVLRADAAGVAVGLVDAADRQADVVDNGRQLIRRDGLANGLLDMVEQGGGVLQPRADRRAHMQRHLAGIDAREEVRSQEGRQTEGQHDETQEAGDEHAAPRQRQGKGPAIALADL